MIGVIIGDIAPFLGIFSVFIAGATLFFVVSMPGNPAFMWDANQLGTRTLYARHSAHCMFTELLARGVWYGN